MLIENRRENVRMKTLIPCGICTRDLDSWGFLLDLSSTGIQVKTYFQLDPFQNTLVSFSLSNKFNFKNVEGRIMWVQRTDDYNLVGIRFAGAMDKSSVVSAMRNLLDQAA